MTEPLGKQAFLAVMEDGKEHRVTREFFDEFLNILPPVIVQPIPYQGKTWEYGFAEGDDRVILFRRSGGECFARLTPFYNPYERGSIRSQQQRLVFEWAKLGKQDPRLGREFGIPSFHESRSDADLIRDLSNPMHATGTAFYVGDIAVIKTEADGWLTLKGAQVVETIPWGQIIAEKGPEMAQDYIDGIRAARPQDIDQARGNARG